MKLEQSFEVSAPVDRVWRALIDVEHVAPCLPGAAITGRNEDGSYNGTFTIKIGPTTASYSGRLEMERADQASHTAAMQAQGNDKRGQGGAKATIVSTLEPAGDGTRVSVDTEYHITGRLARFGRGGMIEDISERLLKEFAQRLQASLEDEPAPIEPVPAEERREPPGADGDEPERQEESDLDAQESEPAPAPTDAPEATTNGGAPASEPAPAAAPIEPAPPIEGISLIGSVLLDRVRRAPVPWIVGVLALLWIRRRRRRARAVDWP